MTDTYDAIVIGSGLGGLTAGALYARASHRVLLLERNQNFGGAASTYQHGALTIEASLHETTDPHDQRDPKNQIFHALGILDDIKLVPVGDLYEVRSPLLGKPFVMPHGLERAKGNLVHRFPEHEKAFNELFKRIESVGNALALFSEKHDGMWWFLHAPSLPFHLWPLLHDMTKSLSEVFEKLFAEDEAVKIAMAANLPYYADDPEQMWWLAYAVAQGGFLSGGGFYIEGGSQVLSNRLVELIEEEGVAMAGRTVARILLDDEGKAAGVEHQAFDGGDVQTDYAPVLFGNAAPHVLAKALPSDVREGFMKPYEEQSLSLSLFSVALGLDKSPAELGVSSYSTVLFPEWMTSLTDYRHNAELLANPPGEAMPALTMVDYSRIQSGLNKEPPFLVAVVGLDQYDNWADRDKAEYDAHRDQWLDAIINTLDKEYPGFAEAVIQKEMATARTMASYLNTPGGAIYGFAPRPPEHLPLKGPPRKPQTMIEGLWLASAFAGAGGFTGAMMGGATAAQAALRKASVK